MKSPKATPASRSCWSPSLWIDLLEVLPLYIDLPVTFLSVGGKDPSRLQCSVSCLFVNKYRRKGIRGCTRTGRVLGLYNPWKILCGTRSDEPLCWLFMSADLFGIAILEMEMFSASLGAKRQQWQQKFSHMYLLLPVHVWGLAPATQLLLFTSPAERWACAPP